MKSQPADTIVAISTALGTGAVALVRLSGDDAPGIADSIFRGSRRLQDSDSHTVHYGHVVDADGRTVDEVLATVLLAPHTYTTEHMIEFGCHGGSIAARRVLGACLEAGARAARRGEFTERAFINGRLDLVQAEAVADIVAAKTPTGLALALGQLEGGLSGKLCELRGTLIDLRAEIEGALDLSEDMDGSIDPDVTGHCGKAERQVSDLLRNCGLGAAVRDGVCAAIVGKPNVGKSSLMNALLKRDRSIVTSLPGTTRDVVEEVLHLEGIPVRLIDTAGLGAPGDEAEEAGMSRARAAAGGAALTILVLDVSVGLDGEDLAVARSLDPAKTIIAANKTDLRPAPDPAYVADFLGTAGPWTPLGAIPVSALHGTGLSELRGAISAACARGSSSDAVDVTNIRHIEALKRVLRALERTKELAISQAPWELVAAEVAAGTDALGEISGETTPEDVIQRIFERFCVGK